MANEGKDPPPENLRTLNIDGASNKQGFGVGLILKNMEDSKITYALHFDFHTSKNIIEYKTLLTWMRLAK